MNDIVPEYGQRDEDQNFPISEDRIDASFVGFVDEPPSVAAGGNGVVIPGCPACRKRINTNDQYLRHLSDDVLPVILRKAFEIAGVSISK